MYEAKSLHETHSAEICIIIIIIGTDYCCVSTACACVCVFVYVEMMDVMAVPVCAGGGAGNAAYDFCARICVQEAVCVWRWWWI